MASLSTTQARAEEEAIAKRQGQSIPVYNQTARASTIANVNTSLSNINTKAQGPAAIDYSKLGYTGAYALGEGDVVDPATGSIKRAGGWQSAGPYQTFTKANGQSYSNTGGKQAFDAEQKRFQTGIVDSAAAKTDLSKIQTDFQSILSSLSNKQQYNQAGLNATSSVVDLMKSKGIADTSTQARTQLAQQAGISDYNPANAESNKKLAEAIMSSKAVGSAMSQMTPGTPAYDSALGKVSGAVSNTSATGNMQGVQTQGQAPAVPLTSTGTKVSEDPMQAQYDSVTKEIDDNSTAIKASLDQLKTGAIPLTADQTAVVDATQRSFDNAIAQQKSANQNQENVVRQSSFRSGSEYTPEVSSSIIKNVIDSNVLKISEYDQKAIAAVAELKQNFKDANYKAIKEGYTELNKTLKDKQDNIISMMKLSHDYEKASLAHSLDVLQQKETARHNKASEGLDTSRYNETLRSNMANERLAVSKYEGSAEEKKDKFVTNLNQYISRDDSYKKAIAAKTSTDNVLMSLGQRNGVGDISAINQFQKLIDDGAVTRDQDVQLIKSAQSLYGQVGTKIKGWTDGDQLGQELRDQMTQVTNQLYQGFEKNLKNNPFIKSKIKEAELNGVDINNTILSEIMSLGEQPQAAATKIDLQSVMSGARADADAKKARGEITQEQADQQVYEAVRDAKTHNASLSNVGGDTNKASKIALAIKEAESGGNYKAVGDAGTSKGAYQFQPASWSGWSKQYLGNANLPMTPENQDKVAIARIQDLLDQGYDARQVALIWNGGEPKEKKGFNKKIGLAYDSGAYANKVLKILNQA